MKIGIIISIFIHILILTIYVDNSVLRIKEKFKEIKIVLNSSNRKQIVTVDNFEGFVNKDSTRFISDKDRSTSKQTIARNIGAHKKAGKGSFENNNLSDLKLSDISFDDKSFNTRKIASINKSNGVEKGDDGKSGKGQISDYVDDIPLGDLTSLNTNRFQYYSYFNRIKLKLEVYWRNSIREKARQLGQQDRNIFINGNKITSLVVLIDEDGSIISIKIQTPSGINELDEVAVESFNKSGPFPNPPKGMLNDGVAKIEWGFVVQS